MSDQITPEGYEALKAEVAELEGPARREIAERIKTAREWGDLKENSEYHDAKNEQSMLETKILGVRAAMRRAEIPAGDSGGDVVGFGSRVTVIDEMSRRELSYTLVAAVTADPGGGKVATRPPARRALT